jgi:hypothetical protein
MEFSADSQRQGSLSIIQVDAKGHQRWSDPLIA